MRQPALLALRGGSSLTLPAHVRAEVQRILEAEARRLLTDQLNGDAIGSAAGRDEYPLDGGADQRAARV